MKTTIELPDELFRRAKAVAALRGESLRQLMTTALQRELDVGRPAEAVPSTGAADGLLRQLDDLAAQVSASWVGPQDALEAVREQRRT